MKAEEFRIGNLLQDREGRLCKVEEIHIEEGFKAPAISGPMTGLPNRPIILNEDWLTRAGFKFYWMSNLCLIELNINDQLRFMRPYRQDNLGGIELELRFGSINTGVNKIIYLHDLQNLYSALTGQELEINLQGL